MRTLVALTLALSSVVAACGSSSAAAPSASVTTSPAFGAVVVTRANDHATVRARVGDRIQIALGSEYDWRLDPPDGVVLVRGVQDQALVKGTQAIWTAAAPGTTTISATGTVSCPSGQACIMIAILFTTTVVVSAP